jgi:hypothetical protein
MYLLLRGTLRPIGDISFLGGHEGREFALIVLEGASDYFDFDNHLVYSFFFHETTLLSLQGEGSDVPHQIAI